MKRLKTTVLFFSILFANSTYTQIVIDSYKNGERRIQTTSRQYKGFNYILDTYANEQTNDTVYYLKVGVKDLPDSIVTGNKLIIKVSPKKQAEVDTNGHLTGYIQVAPDTTLTLVCSQITPKKNSPVMYTRHSATHPFYSSNGFSITETHTSCYQVAFYPIRKADIEMLIDRGTKAIRLETDNNVSDYKVSRLANIIKKLYVSVLKQFAKPCLKRQVDNF